MRTASAVVAIVAALLAAGCSRSLAVPDGAPPELVARRYFELRAAGDDGTARQLLWRPQRFDTAVEETGYEGLTDLTVGGSREDTAANRPEEYRALSDIRLIRVEYVRHHTDSVGSPPGRDGRFVLLGRESEHGPWLVIEVGTGP